MNGNDKDSTKGKNDSIQKYFFVITLVIEIMFGIMLIVLLACFFWGKTQLDIFTTLGLGLIIVWIAIMVLYYSWAIYFYNVNFGLTDRDWQRIENAGNDDPAVETRDGNPEKGESLGLPAGTVRATIAISILVGGLALFIASLGRNNILRESQVYVDYFDFFKNAFLMMIAFYFGAKSLEVLVAPKAKANPDAGSAPVQNSPETMKETITDQPEAGKI